MPDESRDSQQKDNAPTEGGKAPARGGLPLTVLGIYPWDRFWSMGEFKGAPSFFLAPQALLKAGHSVHISMPKGGEIAVSSASQSPAGRSGAGAETYHGMRLHRYGPGMDFMPMKGGRLYIHLTRPLKYICYIKLATLAGIRAARACRPDVVVGYGAWAAPVAYFIARSFGLPNVTRLFGQSIAPHGTARLRGGVRSFLNFPELIAFMTGCSALIVCDDGTGSDRVAERLGVPASRLRFWRNGVDKELFRPAVDRRKMKADLGLDPEAPLLLSASRLDEEKHHDRFIRALPEVLESSPGAQALIMGEGPQRDRLEAEASRLGVSSSVRMPGAVPQKELARHYRACDVFLSLSNRSNVSNPTLEAMCCGACVVALDAGDTARAIRSGENGMLVGEEDLPRLGALLAGLLEDGARRSALGEGAAAFGAEHVPSIEQRSRMEAEAVASAVKEPP